MSKQKSNKRRQLLIGAASGIAGATQLPRSWTKPIINSVILPVHASTTDDTGSGAPGITTTSAPVTSYSGPLTFNPMQTKSDGVLIDVLSVFVPDAHASPNVDGGQMCIDTSSLPNFTAQVLITAGTAAGLYTGSGVLGASSMLLSHVSGCNFFNPVMLEVLTPVTAGAPYRVTAQGGYEVATGTLPAGSDCPPDPGPCL